MMIREQRVNFCVIPVFKVHTSHTHEAQYQCGFSWMRSENRTHNQSCRIDPILGRILLLIALRRPQSEADWCDGRFRNSLGVILWVICERSTLGPSQKTYSCCGTSQCCGDVLYHRIQFSRSLSDGRKIDWGPGKVVLILPVLQAWLDSACQCLPQWSTVDNTSLLPEQSLLVNQTTQALTIELNSTCENLDIKWTLWIIGALFYQE